MFIYKVNNYGDDEGVKYRAHHTYCILQLFKDVNKESRNKYLFNNTIITKF